MTRRLGRSDYTTFSPTDRGLSDWQFGVRDVLAATAAIAAVTGLIAWIQPYPFWILEFGKSAVVHTGTYGVLLITHIVTIVPGAWFSGYLFLRETIRLRDLIILVLLAATDSMIKVLTTGGLCWMVHGVPVSIVLDIVRPLLESTLLCWAILAISFLLLRMAGFRITRARSRVLRGWATSE